MYSKTDIKDKNKRKIFLFFAALLIFAVFFQYHQASAQNQYRYEPMESIPGFEYDNTTSSSQFKSLVEGIYKFGIWTVGIAALLMIIIGGFMYMTSAGNTAKAGTAKSIIWDAIYALIVALFAWLILNVINPDLVTINIRMPLVPNPNPGGAATNPISPRSGIPPSSTRPTQPQTPGITSNINCNVYNTNSNLRNEMAAATNQTGVPATILAAFMSRECSAALTSATACTRNNSSGAGGPMQFTDATWNDPRYGCTGSKYIRADALMCAAKKISIDTGGSGGSWTNDRVYRAACRYCGACVSANCGGNYAGGIVANWQAYQNC